MCALCGILVDGPHWTEAGTDAGRSDSPPSGRSRYLDRKYRLAILNKILAIYGCHAEDWAVSQYVVRNISGGATEVVNDLPMIWLAVERLTKKLPDPLDPVLLSTLEKTVPVAH